MRIRSVNKLPEELLHEVLTYILDVSWTTHWLLNRKTGLSTHRTGPQPRDVLLVCKKWRRIGTPLLYQSLYLMKDEHINRVAAVIKGTPSLAKAIRRIWVALPACTANLPRIVRRATRATELYVWMGLGCTAAHAEHFTDALAAARPKTLFLGGPAYERYNYYNMNARRLRSHARLPDTLQEDIERASRTMRVAINGPWRKTLTTVHLSFQSVASLMVDLQTAIVANLFRGDGLRKVTVDIMFTEELIVRTRQAHPRAAADTGLPRELTSRAGRCHPWEPPHDVFKMEPRVFKSQCLAKCIKLERYDMPFRSCRSCF